MQNYESNSKKNRQSNQNPKISISSADSIISSYTKNTASLSSSNIKPFKKNELSNSSNSTSETSHENNNFSNEIKIFESQKMKIDELYKKICHNADEHFIQLNRYVDSYLTLPSFFSNRIRHKRAILINYSDYQKVKRLNDLIVTKTSIQKTSSSHRKLKSNSRNVESNGFDSFLLLKNENEIVPQIMSLNLNEQDSSGTTLDITWNLVDKLSKMPILHNALLEKIQTYEIFCYRYLLNVSEDEEGDCDKTNPSTWTLVFK